MAVPARRSANQDALAAPGVHAFLIADVRGYTRFTETHGDSAAARLAKRFAQVAREAVAARGGQVVELRGDEALAVFSSARQAIRAAAELQLALAEETAADPSLPLGAGIGLDAGEAIPVEGGFRGGALNLASRLCAKAGPGETLASGGIVHLARAVEGIRFDEGGTETFKGIDEPVRFVRVVAMPGGTLPRLSPTPGELPPGLDAAVAPLVGREPELWWLRGSWRLARRGRGRLLALSGPTGIGRTRLAIEFARVVHDEGAVVRYLALEGEPDGLDRLSAELATDVPTLVVVDDLDLAAPAALARLAKLTDDLSTSPNLVLATCRDDVPSPPLAEFLARLDATDAHLALDPVDADAVLAIVGVYSSRPRAEMPVASILEASGGVPGAIHALAAEWARTEASRRLGSVATRASTGRRELRAIEAELTDNVIDLQQIRERSRLVTVGAAPDGAVCPFKGLAAFESADADRFFGRERLVAELVARLVGASFLGVVGPSGSGKSSAVRAGLLPALANGVLPGSEGWRQVLLRPGAAPMETLRRAVGAEADADPVGAILDGLGSNERVVVVVDQFEEIFTACEDEAARAELVEAIVRLAADPDRRAKVVAALRADFYGRYAAYPALADLLATGHVLVGPMQAEEFRRAIELPAQGAGLRIEPALVDALVADVIDEPGALPLLSTALLELWTRRDGRTLRMAAYEQSGGVRGAVARMAEEAYAGLPTAEQPVARAVLLRLANEDESRTIARRRAPLTEFDTADAAVADVIASLTARRLLTVDEGSVEVAHEALLREWPRLAGWLDEDAQGRGLRRHLTATAREWEAADRDPAELYRGARLASALDWTAEHDVELNALEREFLAESRAATEREAERVRRTNRRLRVLLGAAVAALAVAVVAGGYAVVQQRQAEQSAADAETQRQEAVAQRQLAESQKAAAEHAALVADAHRIGAQALTADAIDVSLLLAREAVALDPSLETQSSLLAALERAPAAIEVFQGGEPIEWVDITPDGSILVAKDNLGRIMFWDALERTPLLSGAEFSTSLFGHDMAPDGGHIAVVDDNPDRPRVGLIDVAGRFVERTVDAPGTRGPVIYTADGTAIVTVDDEAGPAGRRDLVFRDPANLTPTGRRIPIASGDGNMGLTRVATDRVAYALLGSGGGRSVVQVVDLASGRIVNELPFGGPVAATPDGSLLAVGREDGGISFVDLPDGRVRTVGGGHEGQVTGLRFTPDGATLISVGLDRDVLTWDVATRSVREVLRGHSGPAFGPALDPDGSTAYTGSFDGTIIGWDLVGDRRLVVPFSLGADASSWSVHFAAVTGDGRTLVYALPGGRVRVHDLTGATGDRDVVVWGAADVAAISGSLAAETLPRTGEIVDLAGQPGGSEVAITSDLPVPVLLDTATGSLRRLADGHDGSYVQAVAFSADGRRLATGGGDEQVAIWDVASGRLIDRLASGNGTPLALAFSPTGDRLAVGGTGSAGYGTVNVWDLASKTPVASVQADPWQAWAVGFTADGTRIVTAGDQSGDVKVWEVAQERQVVAIPAHAGPAFDVAVDPGGRFIASAGQDGVARLWDLATGQAIGTPLTVHQGVTDFGPVAIDLFDGGRRLLEVNARGEGAIWPLDESLWAAHACDVAGRTLTQPELNQYLPGRTAPVGCTD